MEYSSSKKRIQILLDIRDALKIMSKLIPAEHHSKSSDEPPTSPIPYSLHDQNPHLDDETPPDDQTKEALPHSVTDTTEDLIPTDIPHQTQLLDSDEKSYSESFDSDFEEPLDWDDMDPAQRHD